MTRARSSVSLAMMLLYGAAVAICALHPYLGESLCARYGALIDEAAKAEGVRPALVVGLISHESDFRPTVVNGASDASGLGQILPSTRPACKRDPASDECAAEKRRLLDPAYNIKLVASGLRKWREACRKNTGIRPTEADMVAGYGGFSDVRKRRWCLRQKNGRKWHRVPQPQAVREVMKLVRRADRAMSKAGGDT